MPNTHATITHVRVKTAKGSLDPHTTRQHLQRGLGAMTLQPTSVPPHSIVYIRRLRSAMPLQHAHAPLPNHESVWQHKLHAQINACAANAVRPALGFVPANANAVLFNDEAEQLACLAHDWLRGAAQQHWWWAALLARGGVDEAVCAAWLRAPAHAPAALAHLAGRAAAEPFLQRLPQAVVLGLLQRVMTLFGLRHLEPVLSHPCLTDETRIDTAHLPLAETYAVQGSHPWQAWWPNTALHALAPTATCLLGISLGLQRHAARVQSPEFAQHILAWLDAATTQATASTSFVSAAPHSHHAAHNPSVAPVAAAPNAAGKTTPHTSPTNYAAPLAQPESHVTLSPAHQNHNALSAATQAGPTSNVVAPFSPLNTTPTPAPARTDHQFTDDVIDVMRIHTQFGGTFYLVNVMLHLGWYADFTQPLRRGLDQNIYALLAWIGEQTFGEHFRADALWDALVQLAGPDAPAALPAQVGHPLLAEQLRTLQHRLAQAFGEPNTGDAIVRDAIAFVCAHPARVVITTTRIDVFLSLEHLPIAIRLSGIDRDPGWVPAAGRAIAFHFD